MAGKTTAPSQAAACVMPHLTVQERIDRGKAARTGCPRSSHAAWNLPGDRPDPIDLLEAQAKVDFALSFITFLLVLVLDLLPTMIAGIGFSIVYVIYRVSFPGRTVLGRVSDTGDYEVMSWQYGRRGGTTDSKAKPVPGVIVYRFGAPLVFANAEAFKNTGKALLIKAGAEGSLPHRVVVDFEEVAWVDATGAEAVGAFFDYAQRYGVDLSLAQVQENARKLLQLGGVTEKIGEQRIYDTVRNAVDAATSSTTAQANKRRQIHDICLARVSKIMLATGR